MKLTDSVLKSCGSFLSIQIQVVHPGGANEIEERCLVDIKPSLAEEHHVQRISS